MGLDLVTDHSFDLGDRNTLTVCLSDVQIEDMLRTFLMRKWVLHESAAGLRVESMGEDGEIWAAVYQGDAQLWETHRSPVPLIDPDMQKLDAEVQRLRREAAWWAGNHVLGVAS